MTFRRQAAVVLLAAVTVFAGACTSGPPPPIDARPYEERIQAFRADKDFFFRTSSDSPLRSADRTGFRGLAYFPVDPAFRVPAFLTEERSNPPVIIVLQTSGQNPDRMRRVGTLGFTINGTSYSLTAFASVDARTVTHLFVPFTDATSGAETYKGGRYLDLDRTPTGLYEVDFNRAYHPNCVYDVSWVCPIPPRENRLPLALQAGERLPPP